MQKKDGNKTAGLCMADIQALLLGILVGLAALCLCSLVFAVLMLYAGLPMRLLPLYAGFTLFLSGFCAAAAIGPRGRMLLFVPTAALLMTGAIYLTGLLLFGGSFLGAGSALLMTALFFGLAVGSAAVNLR